ENPEPSEIWIMASYLGDNCSKKLSYSKVLTAAVLHVFPLFPTYSKISFGVISIPSLKSSLSINTCSGINEISNSSKILADKSQVLSEVIFITFFHLYYIRHIFFHINYNTRIFSPSQNRREILLIISIIITMQN